MSVRLVHTLAWTKNLSKLSCAKMGGKPQFLLVDTNWSPASSRTVLHTLTWTWYTTLSMVDRKIEALSPPQVGHAMICKASFIATTHKTNCDCLNEHLPTKFYIIYVFLVFCFSHHAGHSQVFCPTAHKILAMCQQIKRQCAKLQSSRWWASGWGNVFLKYHI